MVRALLIGAVAGMRSLLPIALLSNASRLRKLSHQSGGPLALLSHPVVSKGAIVLAVGELLGDKLPAAPNRTSVAGLAARAVTGAFAAAALSPSDRRRSAAVLGGVAAIAGAYVSFAARARSMRRFGQVSTGLLEDAIALGGALCILSGTSERWERRLTR